MSILKNPVVLSLVGSLLAVLALYVNNKVSKEEHKKKDYLKLFFLVFIILFITLQIFIFNVENDSGVSFESGKMNIEMRGGNPDF
tara:strand:- start:131 stop:385 length:255 start_codon:yes stop_codon:yes gene_type:complete